MRTQPHWLNTSLRRRWLDDDLESVAGRMQGTVLEIGNGRAMRRGRFGPPPDRNITWFCLDLRARARPHIIGDAQRLPCASESFNCVVCAEVGEYLPRPAQALSEIARVLRPGGRLIWASPFLHRADAENDLWRFTEAGLRRLMNDAGLEVREMRTQGAALGVAANILRYAVMAIHHRAFRIIIAGLAYLPLRLLAAADDWTAQAVPALASFSTGYVALAVKPASQQTMNQPSQAKWD